MGAVAFVGLGTAVVVVSVYLNGFDALQLALRYGFVNGTVGQQGTGELGAKRVGRHGPDVAVGGIHQLDAQRHGVDVIERNALQRISINNLVFSQLFLFL